MMKIFLTVFITLILSSCGQTSKKENEKIQIVEAACGQCQFGLKGKGCDLAIRIDGKAYFVDGTKIDDHGDAHAQDGFCEAIRKAEVTGAIVEGRYKANSFKLLLQNNVEKHAQP